MSSVWDVPSVFFLHDWTRLALSVSRAFFVFFSWYLLIVLRYFSTNGRAIEHCSLRPECNSIKTHDNIAKCMGSCTEMNSIVKFE